MRSFTQEYVFINVYEHKKLLKSSYKTQTEKKIAAIASFFLGAFREIEKDSFAQKWDNILKRNGIKNGQNKNEIQIRMSRLKNSNRNSLNRKSYIFVNDSEKAASIHLAHMQ